MPQSNLRTPIRVRDILRKIQRLPVPYVPGVLLDRVVNRLVRMVPVDGGSIPPRDGPPQRRRQIIDEKATLRSLGPGRVLVSHGEAPREMPRPGVASSLHVPPDLPASGSRDDLHEELAAVPFVDELHGHDPRGGHD